MSLLTAVQTACNELALASPTAVIGNTDPQITQFLALANREGQQMRLYAGHTSGLQQLRKEYIFNMVPASGGVGGIYTATTTAQSNVLTNMTTTTGILVGYGVSGGSILTGAIVTGVTPGPGGTVTLNTPSTVSASGQNFSFGQIGYALPSDIAFFISASMWDRNFRWQLLGPISAQEWQTIVSGISPVGPRIRYRIMQNQFFLQPPPGPTQTDTIAFEYITKNWCQGVNDTGPTQTAFQADTDLYTFDENLLILGMKWRFLRAKNLDYGEEYNEWERARDAFIGRDGANRALPLNASAHGLRLLSNMNVPDTGFGT